MELPETEGEKGRFVFLFNHADKSAHVKFAEELEQPAVRVQEIVSGEAQKADGRRIQVTVEVLAQAVRIYRIDY